MNAGLAHTIESLFGPVSEIIDVSDFLKSATNATEITRDSTAPTIQNVFAEECRWHLLHIYIGQP
jgi:hypothetical protein